MNKNCRNSSLLLIDDSKISQIGISKLFADRNINLIDIAWNTSTGLEKVFSLKPDVVITNIYSSNVNGIELTQQVKSLQPETKIIFFSDCTDEEKINKALASGADGFCHKADDIKNLERAINVALKDGVYIDKNFKTAFENIAKTNFSPKPEKRLEDLNLNGRQLETLRMLAKGEQNKQIAKKLKIKEDTVKYHIGQLFAKLGVDNRVQAAIEGWKLGLF